MRMVGISLGVIVLALAAPASTHAAPKHLDAQLQAPADGVAYFNRTQEARKAAEAGDWARAEGLFTQLVGEFPLERTAWAGLGTAKRRLGKHKEAIIAYERAIALIGPTRGSARYQVAASYTDAGDYDAALDTLEKLVFADADLDRPGLLDDPTFASLRDSPRFKAIAGAADASSLTRDQGWLVDTEHLVSEIRRLSPDHRNGLPSASRIAYERLKRDIPQLSDEQVYAELSKIVGGLRQNHSILLPASGGRVPFTFLPVKMYVFPEGIFVIDAAEGYRDLIGAQVLAFDATPADEALDRVADALSYYGDIEAIWTGPKKLGEAQLLEGLGIVPDASKVTLRLKLPSGRAVSRTLPSVASEIASNKLNAPPTAEAPRFLKRIQEAHWFERMGNQALYVQVNQILPDRIRDGRWL